MGKQIGVFGFAYAAIATGLAARPRDASMLQLYGVSLLAGIGFTMSLFIGALAFADPEHQKLVRIGVISGSILSGTLGALILAFAPRRAGQGGRTERPTSENKSLSDESMRLQPAE